MNNDDSPFASRREPAGLPPSPIDLAIDRAVRKMMQVDPPAGLRRRVMARIESPPPRRSFFVPAYGRRCRAGDRDPGCVGCAQQSRGSFIGGRPSRGGKGAGAGGGHPRRAGTQPDAGPPPRPERRRRAATIGLPPRADPDATAVADIFGTRTTAIAAAADPDRRRGLDCSARARCRQQHRRTGAARRQPVVPADRTPPIVIAPIVVGRPPTAPPGPPR